MYAGIGCTNPLLDSLGVRPLIDQYVYCLTTTFSFPLPEGDKLAPSTQKNSLRNTTFFQIRNPSANLLALLRTHQEKVLHVHL